MAADENERAGALRDAVLRIREANAKTYGSDEQRAAIKTAVARSFTLRGVYLFELVQNALDVGATRVRIDWSESQLTLEHDGPELFDERSIAALSKLGMSTKSRLDTVGFMGLGFKSVFERFERVDISDSDLRMYFEVGYDEGAAYGDRHKRWIDLVLPAWDDAILPPSESYTTRFALVRPLAATSLADDVHALAPNDDGVPHALAILALRGLRELVVGSSSWSIKLQSVGDVESVEITDTEKSYRWLVARQPYRPSKNAIRRLLEHRDLKLDVESESAARARDVVALLSTDENLVPKLDGKGQVFATLPTGVELKLRLLIQADWLLNTGRDGLVSAVDNAWQAEIVGQIPPLLGKVVKWIADASQSNREALHALDLLADVGSASTDFHGALARPEMLTAIAGALADLEFVPVHVEGKDAPRTVRPRDVADVPAELLPPFQHADDLVPSLVFGGPIIDATFAREHGRAVEALRNLGLFVPVGLERLAHLWPAALNDWWSAATQQTASMDHAAAEARAAMAVLKLAAAISRLSQPDARWASLPCILTSAGSFATAQDVRRYASPAPAADEEFGAALRDLLPEALVPAEQLVHPLLQRLSDRQSDDAAAAKKLLAQGKAVHPWERIREALPAALAAGRIGPRFVAMLAAWALDRKQPDLVTHIVVVDEDGQDAVALASSAVVAEPFVEGGLARQSVFPRRRAVSQALLLHRPANEWRPFLESVPGIAGPLRLVESKERMWSGSAFEARAGINEYSTRGYEIVDHDFEPDVDVTAPEFASWLERSYATLRWNGMLTASWFYRTEHYRRGPKHCRWVLRLNETPWVPSIGDQRARPCDVVVVRESDDQPLAAISAGLARALEAEGVPFGTKVPRPGPLTRLRGRGPHLASLELASLLRDCISEATTDEQQRALLEVVLELPIPVVGEERRVTVERLVEHVGGGRYRSDLRGHVLAIDKIDPQVAAELRRVPGVRLAETTSGQHALAFLRDVWRRAIRDRPSADLVNILPTAYGYLAEDVESDRALAATLEAARGEVRVSVGGTWLPPDSADSLVLIDDTFDPELRALVPDAKFASPSHLADRPDKIARVARLLRLQLLSDRLDPKFELGAAMHPSWASRMTLILRAFAMLDDRVELRLVINDSITVVAGGRRLQRNAASDRGVLHVTTSPSDFDCEAATLISTHYRIEQRGPVAELVKTIQCIAKSREEFVRQFERLALNFQLDEEEVALLVRTLDAGTTRPPSSGAAQQSDAADSGGVDDGRGRSEEKRPPGDDDPRDAQDVEGGYGVDGGRRHRDESDDDDEDESIHRDESDDDDEDESSYRDESDDEEDERSDGDDEDIADDDDDIDVAAHTRQRRSRRAPRAGYGFVPPDNRPGGAPGEPKGDEDDEDDGQEHERVWPDDATGPDARRRYVVVDPRAPHRSRRRDRQPPTDAPARAAVVAFERARGRQPKVMGDKQEGYDVESLDPDNGRTRRIEIKTIAGIWRDEASVYLSEPQFRAGAMNRDPGLEYWLYVVDAHRIYPVPWRSVGVARFFFYANDWVDLAQDIGDRDATDRERASDDASPEPGTDEVLFEPDWWPAVTAMRAASLIVTAGTDVVDDTGRVTGQTVAVASRSGLDVVIIDDSSREADATARAVADTGAAFIRTRADRAASEVRCWFEERDLVSPPR